MAYFLVRKMTVIFLYGLPEEHEITPTLAWQRSAVLCYEHQGACAWAIC